MNTSTQRAVSYRMTTFGDFQPRAQANAKARKEKWAGLKDRMFERIRERRVLAAKTAPLEEKKEVILEKRKNDLIDTAIVVGIAAACSVTAFALERNVVGGLYAFGGAVTALYGTIKVSYESGQLAQIREGIASIKSTLA